MTRNLHWDYFLALEEDAAHLTRFIHFSTANLNTYSIELARLLMASTQEIDVLLKQICAKHGDPSAKEPGYRAFFSKGDYSKIRGIQVSVRPYGLTFTPFANWIRDAPDWWTATNKVKHQRHTDFGKASLGNFLSSLCALLIANMYFAKEERTLSKDVIPLRLLLPVKLVQSAVMAAHMILKMP